MLELTGPFMVFSSTSQSSNGRKCHGETVQQAGVELEPRARRLLSNRRVSHQGEPRTRASPGPGGVASTPHRFFPDSPKVREVSRRRGEVTTTRLISVAAPPFRYEVPGLQAVTQYNISVSCSNEVGASPVATWIQSNTTEGGVWA